MSVISNMEAAAEAVGINAVITESDRAINTQLVSLSKEEMHPLMLISWDMERDLTFDEHGFLRSVGVKVVCLLLTKPEDLTKEEAKYEAEKMGVKFEQFLKALYDILAPTMVNMNQLPVSAVGYKLVPWHGISKHSGVLGRFTMGYNPANTCV